MTYNRFLYNSALYNAGREEAGAIIRSIISAHTGPHIQAVVVGEGGTSFISDFTITEGTFKKPPTQFKFPDLRATIRVFQTQAPREDNLSIDLLNVCIRGFGFKNLPASIFIVDHIPVLAATIFDLFQANLLANIIGELGMKDLPAIIQVTVADLGGQMTGVPAPSFFASIFAQSPGNLGARIHAPLDLSAILQAVQSGDLPADITGISFLDLAGSMLGLAAPTLPAFLRAIDSGTGNMPASIRLSAFTPNLPATITPTLTGATGLGVGFTAIIEPSGGFKDLRGIIRSLLASTDTLGAIINGRDEFDLPAIINFLSAKTLKGSLQSIPLGERDRFLNAFLQPVRTSDLGAVMTFNQNVALLGAQILALHGTSDLGAIIKVSETFVTAILTVVTLASRNLRATIGRPECEGGSANKNLGANTVAQLKGDLGAFIQSFAQTNLGASINTQDIFFAFDTIGVTFAPFTLPGDPGFNATDTIPVLFSPFRGKNLGAVISSIQNNVFLPATITAVFPLAKVVPAIHRLTAADLRFDEDLDIQEIRLQLEGTLFEYIYVNGTDQALIKDPNETWKINVRSFKPIAAGLFGDHAAAKICRLGSLVEFKTIDQAVRFCIQAVLGFQEEVNLGAIITPSGGIKDLSVFLDIQNNFKNLTALANRVFPADLGAQVEVTGDSLNLMALIQSNTIEAEADLGAVIEDIRQGDLGAEIEIDMP